MPRSEPDAAVAVLPQVAHGAVFLNTRLQTRARAAAAVGAPASSAPAYTVPMPMVAPAEVNAKATIKGKGKGKGKGKATGKGKASASSKSRNSSKSKSKRKSKQQPVQKASTASISFDEFSALVEAETTALRIEAARDDALLAEYQNMSDIGSQLHAMAMPAVDQLTMDSMLSSAASGAPEDVFSWLAAKQNPTASSCDDSEFLALCTAFGLLEC